LDIVGEGVTLVLGAPPPTVDYLEFEQSRPFFYLTGFREPEAALVLVQRGGVRTAWIFVQPNDAYEEVWTGVRLGPGAARERLGIDGREFGALYAVLDSLLANKSVQLHVAGDLGTQGTIVSPHKQMVERVRQKYLGARITDVTGAVLSVRAVKSAAELDRLRIAAGITARGHLAAMRLVTPGVGEFELQAAAEHEWRREGSEGPGFGSIVASGPNSTTLHYLENSRIAEAGDVVVMDLGASFDGYTADITRTIPVGGKFTPTQREIYQIVLDAQKAAERQVWVGAAAELMSDSANAVLAAGLARLGLIESAGATYDCGSDVRPRQCAQLGLFYLHSLGHGIGLDVHDPAEYYETGVIAAGAAFTIEPGIYVRGHVLKLLKDTPRNREIAKKLAVAVARYAGIGVRIEDDYLVTADGVERISADAPREIGEIEAVLALPRSPRVPGVVERFLRHRTGR
jgi:Xaa-Pro aminopeptidase